MKKILSFELFGVHHKLSSDEDISHAREAAEFLKKEVGNVQQEVFGKPTGRDPFSVLLLTALNISSEYTKLKRAHDAITDRVSRLAARVAENTAQTDRPAGSDPSGGASQPARPTGPDADPAGRPLQSASTPAPASPHGGPASPADQQTESAEPCVDPALNTIVNEQHTEASGGYSLGFCDPRIEGNTSRPADSFAEQPGSEPSPQDEAEPDETGPDKSPQNAAVGPAAPAPRPAQRPEAEHADHPPEAENRGALRTTASQKPFELPSINFLNPPEEPPDSSGDEKLALKAEILENKLNDFGVKGAVSGISPGPVITTFEYKPAPGVKISKIVNLTNDLALALSALSIRIVAPIPGRDVIGIEIPNRQRELVNFRDIVDSERFRNLRSRLRLCLGKDIVGKPVAAELNRMPHLLIAGATGTGKSVGLNAMITSLLYTATPDQVKFIMIDPKRIELSFYNGIPHLISPVVTDMKKATNALFWGVREMERRYELLAENKVRNIAQYNRKMRSQENPQTLPYIVIIIDELADLMMVASRDVEVALARLAQMARAAGIHMILATQRPSVDVLTGTIKANFPTRISFQVSSKTDSRTIIDTNGAETLLGNGDMLFVPPGTAKLQRIHGAYISEEELTRVTEFLKAQQDPVYVDDVTAVPEEENGGDSEEEYDERYDEAVALVTKTRQASISSVQRHLRIGYNRAARIIEMMEREGIVGPPDRSKGREVLVQSFEEIIG